MRKLLLVSSFVILGHSLVIGQNKAQCTFTLTYNVIDFACYNTCGGKCVLYATGGTPPYNWPTGKSSNASDTIYGICAPDTITVTDNAGCTGTTIILSVAYKPGGPGGMYVDSFHVVKPSCPTCCDGRITCYFIDPCNAPPYTCS